MNKVILPVFLTILGVIPALVFAQGEEVRYRLPNFTTNLIQEYGPLSETYPKFLMNIGDFK